MAFDHPELGTLISRAQADIETLLPDTDASVRRTVLHVLTRMLAGGMHGLYGYLDFLAEQLMPDTAESEYLERWAGIWNRTRIAATTASGDAIFTGETGAVVPEGTTVARSDDVEYVTTAEGVLVDGEALVSVECSESGVDGNADSGTKLRLSSPIEGVEATAVSGALTGGADEEDDESLRERLLNRIQQTPQGGCANDYITWAEEVAGVTRAWGYPLELGIGTVTVRFMMDGTYDDGIPLDDDVATVQDYIDNLRPVTADVTLVAPIPVVLNPVIKLSPNTTTVQGIVEAELADVILRESEPGGTIKISHLREAISTAAGETDHELVTPSANVEHGTGEICVLGDITWEDLD